jgi:excisionase family DNA binding protein
VNARAHAQAHSSRASARVGSHLRDARALTPDTQRSEQEEPSRDEPATRGEHTRAYTVEQVAEMLHVGRDKIYYLLRTGQLRSIKIGKLRRITNWHLAEFIATLEDRQA